MARSIATQCADNIRILSAAMVEKASSGHPGGPMGGADFINILYTEFLSFDPDDLSWPFRDRFFSRSWSYVSHALLATNFMWCHVVKRLTKLSSMEELYTWAS